MSDVGQNIKAENANWSFGGETCKDFDEHVLKSIPLYQEGLDLICEVSDYFVKNDSVVYDLGCSTGTAILKLSSRHSSKKNAKFIGVDIEEEMVKYANAKLKEEKSRERVSFVHQDIIEADLMPNDLTIAYYTCQFIHPRVRQNLIDKIYASLNWGGAFLIFEKVRGNDARSQDILTGLYTEFKLAQGYQASEILNKQRSLKGVLEPFSTQGNLDMFKRAGFVDVISIAKWICFEGFLCIK